jgi:hypothetical protein
MVDHRVKDFGEVCHDTKKMHFEKGLKRFLLRCRLLLTTLDLGKCGERAKAAVILYTVNHAFGYAHRKLTWFFLDSC